DRRGAALWVRECIGDRHAHVRVAEVCERGAVAEADERMHDRGRVHDDLDLLVRNAEQEVSLDQLEALVRKRRRVDRDLRAHVPGRVRQSGAGCYVLQLVTRAAAKRSTRRGEHERVDLVDRTALKALERTRMFAVDGNEPAASSPLRGQGKLSCGDEALLVRERKIDAALE